MRHAHHQIDQPVHNGIGTPGTCSGNHTDYHGNHCTDRRGCNAHRHAGRKAFQCTHQQIASQIIRSERMLRRRRLPGIQKISRYGLFRQKNSQSVNGDQNENTCSRQNDKLSPAVFLFHLLTSLVSGSTIPYSRFAIILPVQTNNAENSVIPRRRGTSEFSPASTAALPRPG